MSIHEMKTYDGWRRHILIYIKTDNSLWRSIGDWLYPKNGVQRTYPNHLCEENFKKGSSSCDSDDKCRGCGEVIPDGIKMITLLEKL